jgi:hypothetical protein
MKWMHEKKSCHVEQENTANSQIKTSNNNNVKLRKILNQTISGPKNP